MDLWLIVFYWSLFSGRYTTSSNKDSRQSSQSDISVNGIGQKASTTLVVPKKPQTIIRKYFDGSYY